MFKKLVITGAAAGLLLVSAAGAFAAPTNYGTVHNLTVTVANSGLNFTGGSNSHVRTGNAGAVSNTATVANTNFGRGSAYNNAAVDNTTVTVANSGLNFTGGGRVSTGGAYAESNTLSVVNTNVSFGR